MEQPPPLTATFSFWGTLFGLTLTATKRTRHIAGGLLCLVGFGGVGIAWDRVCGADLRNLRHPQHLRFALGALTHLPMAAAGLALLTERT